MSNKVVMNGFSDELLKQGKVGSHLKGVLTTVDKLLSQSGGGKKSLEYISTFKNPLNTLVKKDLKKPIADISYNKDVSKIDKFVEQELGGMANSLLHLTNNVNSKNSLGTNIGNITKNIFHTVAAQTRGALYKTVSPEAVKRTGLGGKYIKGEGLLSNFKMFDRKIEGKTTSGDLVIKKRKLIRPLSLAATPAGFGVGTYMLSNASGKSNTDSIADGVKETAKWTFAAPIAQGQMISDILK